MRVTETTRPSAGGPCEDEDVSDGRRGTPTVVNGSTSWADELESCMDEVKPVGGEDDADEPAEGVFSAGLRSSVPSAC